ncbi:MAG: Kelch motif protein [Segetibacter sp.]|nr:Kelch motif protein [Segetibacter sp.]
MKFFQALLIILSLFTVQTILCQTPLSLYEWTKKIDSATLYRRDGNGAIQIGQYLYCFGGWNPDKNPITNSEVYRSNGDLTSWEKRPDAPWSARHSFGLTKLQNSIYVLGSDVYNPTSDVWSTRDGESWNLLTNNAPWGNRVLFGTCSHNGALYILGGQASGVYNDGAFGDVWRSTDGINWDKIADGQTHLAKNISGSVISYNGFIYVIGGGTYGGGTSDEYYTNQIWRSNDGISWERRSDPPWRGRQYTNLVVYENRLFMLMGASNPPENPYSSYNLTDIWVMNENEAWEKFDTTTVPARHASGFANYNDKLAVVCGNLCNDVWLMQKIPSGQIATTTYVNKLLQDSINSINATKFQQGGNAFNNTAYIGTKDNNEIQFLTKNKVAAHITTDGSFLVGTDFVDNSYRMQIGGTASLFTTGHILTNGNIVLNQPQSRISWQGGYTFVEGHNAFLRTYVNGLEAMRINASQNLLLGTTSDNGAGRIQTRGNISPSLNASYTLGTANYRWRNIYLKDVDIAGNIQATVPQYVSGGYDVLVRNKATGRFELIVASSQTAQRQASIENSSTVNRGTIPKDKGSDEIANDGATEKEGSSFIYDSNSIELQKKFQTHDEKTKTVITLNTESFESGRYEVQALAATDYNQASAQFSGMFSYDNNGQTVNGEFNLQSQRRKHFDKNVNFEMVESGNNILVKITGEKDKNIKWTIFLKKIKMIAHIPAT